MTTATDYPLPARIGRALSRWNDRRARADRRRDESRTWRAIDAAAQWLYCWGQRT